MTLMPSRILKIGQCRAPNLALLTLFDMVFGKLPLAKDHWEAVQFLRAIWAPAAILYCTAQLVVCFDHSTHSY